MINVVVPPSNYQKLISSKRAAKEQFNCSSCISQRRKSVHVDAPIISALDYLPDIILLSEIWIYNFEKHDYDVIPNFKFEALQ